MKSMVVDDELINRKMLENYLLDYGPCDVFENGNDALEAFTAALQAGEPYDLVTLDVEMPEINGHELLKKLRAVEEKRGVMGSAAARVLMISVHQERESIMPAFRAGCEGYLFKPLDVNQLKSKLEELELL